MVTQFRSFTEKSPLAVTLLIFRGTDWLLFTTTVVDPGAVKVKLAGEVHTGGTPVPVTL